MSMMNSCLHNLNSEGRGLWKTIADGEKNEVCSDKNSP